MDGFGQHASEVSAARVSDYQKSFLAVQQLYFLNAVLTKCSLLYLYHRILSVKVAPVLFSISGSEPRAGFRNSTLFSVLYLARTS